MVQLVLLHFNGADLANECRFLGIQTQQFPPFQSFYQYPYHFAGKLYQLLYNGNGAHLIQLPQLRFHDLRMSLCHEKEPLVSHHGLLHRCHGLRPVDIKMQYHSRKYGQSPEGHYRHYNHLFSHS